MHHDTHNPKTERNCSHTIGKADFFAFPMKFTCLNVLYLMGQLCVSEELQHRKITSEKLTHDWLI